VESAIRHSLIAWWEETAKAPPAQTANAAVPRRQLLTA